MLYYFCYLIFLRLYMYQDFQCHMPLSFSCQSEILATRLDESPFFTPKRTKNALVRLTTFAHQILYYKDL